MVNTIMEWSAVVVLSASEAVAQNLPAACSLLTTAEVGAALGLPLRAPADLDTRVPIGPAKGQTIAKLRMANRPFERSHADGCAGDAECRSTEQPAGL
jgi:hypothetical protein